MAKKKLKTIILEVVVKQYYSFEEGQINGWSTEKVIEAWFKDFNINTFHASRDAHHYGNVDIVKSVKEVTTEELEAEVTPYYKELEAKKKEREEEKREQNRDWQIEWDKAGGENGK